MEKEIVKNETAPSSLPLEQSVVLVGCMNPRMTRSIAAAAKRQGVEVVRLTDDAVRDYLKVKEGGKAGEQSVSEATLEAFLADTSNRITAEKQAEKLWAVMTGKTDIEKAADTRFTETAVVRATTLSHRTANELFNLLRAFGFLEWTNLKKREFVLHFSKNSIHTAIETDVMAMSTATASDILRYKKSLEADENLTPEERASKLAVLKDAILAKLSFD